MEGNSRARYAICINQADTEEKGKQVALMGVVFRSASYVIAWLGLEDEHSRAASELMQQIIANVEVDWRVSSMQPSATTSDPKWADQTELLPWKDGELDSICALFDKPYFYRVWVRQEVTRANKACVQCGQQQMTWNDSRTVVYSLLYKLFYFDGLSDYSYEKYRFLRSLVYNLCTLSYESLSLPALRTRLAGLEGKDPRDRLYALLSLFQPQKRALSITPNYTRSVEDVYTSVARQYYTAFEDLNLLDTCELKSRILVNSMLGSRLVSSDAAARVYQVVLECMCLDYRGLEFHRE